MNTTGPSHEGGIVEEQSAQQNRLASALELDVDVDVDEDLETTNPVLSACDPNLCRTTFLVYIDNYDVSERLIYALRQLKTPRIIPNNHSFESRYPSEFHSYPSIQWIG